MARSGADDWVRAEGLVEGERSHAQRDTQQGSSLHYGRVANPYTALGLAVDHLMSKPAYASIGFVAWSKVLAGQINRGHYVLVLDEKSQVVGMLGWAYANREAAWSWASGDGGLGDGRSGDCIVFNVWSANSRAVKVLLLRGARRAIMGRREIVYRRLYPDGRLRPVRLSVNGFVANHLARPDEASSAHASRSKEHSHG